MDLQRKSLKVKNGRIEELERLLKKSNYQNNKNKKKVTNLEMELESALKRVSFRRRSPGGGGRSKNGSPYGGNRSRNSYKSPSNSRTRIRQRSVPNKRKGGSYTPNYLKK